MTPEIQALFVRAESGPKAYNAFNRGTQTDAQGIRSIVPAARDIDFSSLTLKEVMALQKLPKSNPESVFAVGLYQLTPDTTKHAVDALKLKGSEKLTPELQDRIFSEYLLTEKRPGIAAYIQNEGKNSLKAAQHELSKEWAGMPDPYKSGASHYGKGTSNKAQVDLDVTRSFLQDMRADYAQLRKEGLSKKEAWAGLFDGRTIVRTPDPVAEVQKPAKPAPSETASTKKPKDDEPSLLDDLQDIPIFKSMQSALDSIVGKGASKRIDDLLSSVDESAILKSVDKMVDDIASVPNAALKSLNAKYIAKMANHVPIQINPEPISAPVIPVPVKRTDVPTPPVHVKETQVPIPNCDLSDTDSVRLLHQVQAHLAGEVGSQLGSMTETDAERLARAIVAEARVSGFKHVAELQVTQDRGGLIAFDGAPNSPASRRFYVDRAQATAQTLERSTSIINSVAVGIERQFMDPQLQAAPQVQR